MHSSNPYTDPFIMQWLTNIHPISSSTAEKKIIYRFPGEKTGKKDHFYFIFSQAVAEQRNIIKAGYSLTQKNVPHYISSVPFSFLLQQADIFFVTGVFFF